MSKRKQNQKLKKTSAAVTGKSARRARRGGIRFALAAVLTFAVIGVGLAAFKKSYDIEHDLSVIGKGIPTVVQIHDTGCQLCQRLRKNSNAAMKGLDDQLLYRIADIKTVAGRNLQQRHQVPHVTLLLFDGKGELRNVLSGVKETSILRRAFLTHVKKSSAQDRS